MNDEQRAYLTDAVIGWVVGVVLMSVAWVWFVGDWARAGLEAMGVL
jgi:hypothetical protein